MDEFLFGDQDDSCKRFQQISNKVKRRGNSLKFVLFYLSPGDYHRYHSAATWTTDFRRHIAGKLMPVKPSYVANHPNVFKENERVSLCGQWANGFFSTTFIGATNVGSIVLNFDQELQTNTIFHQGNVVADRLYTEVDSTEYPRLREEGHEISKEANDVITDSKDSGSASDTKILKKASELSDGNESTSSSDEASPLGGNSADELVQGGDSDKDFKSHFNQRDTIDVVKNEGQTYELSNQGFHLEKGQEVGYFNLGSSIMLIFEAPEEADFDLKVGQKVRLGNNIIKVNNDD